jgi:hypothetical protein
MQKKRRQTYRMANQCGLRWFHRAKRVRGAGRNTPEKVPLTPGAVRLGTWFSRAGLDRTRQRWSDAAIKKTDLKARLFDTKEPEYFEKAVDYLIDNHEDLKRDATCAPIFIR